MLSPVCVCPWCQAVSCPAGAVVGLGRLWSPAWCAGEHGASSVVFTEGESSWQKVFHICSFGVSGPASPGLLIFSKYCCSLSLSSHVCPPLPDMTCSSGLPYRDVMVLLLMFVLAPCCSAWPVLSSLVLQAQDSLCSQAVQPCSQVLLESFPSGAEPTHG